MSGLTGEGLDRLMQAVVDAHAVWNRRVVDQCAQPLACRGDCARIRRRRCRGRRIRLDYITQPKSRPPTFVLFCTPRRRGAGRLPALSGQRPAREFDLPGTPIRLTLREKANPFAGREAPPMTETHRPAAPTAPRGRFIFIFITVLLDMLALGIVIPVLPKLVVNFSAATPRAPPRFSGCSAPPGR